MAVYVDDMLMLATVGRLTARWSHLSADTTEELHAFADRLGMKRSWFQSASVYADTETNRAKGRVGKPRRGSRDHYDLTAPKRLLAIRLGAVPVGWGCEPWREEE